MDECITSIIRRLPFTSNDYILTSYVGKGAYSVVFEAISQRYNGKKFAAKVSPLDPSLLSEDGLHEAELEALTQLIHPNIIKVYDYVITTTSNLLYESYKNQQGIDTDSMTDQDIINYINAETPGILENEIYYLVLILDYCENGTLEQLYGIANDEDGENGNLVGQVSLGANSFEQGLILFSNIVDALSYCHSKGISHGDLKPSNIFVNQYNRAIIADFGLASFYTNSIDVMRGTPFYCAPEIFNEGTSYDPFLADIFALGVTSYQIFTRSLPFTEEQLRNGTITDNIKVVFPGYEKDYEISMKKTKKNRNSLNLNIHRLPLNSSDSESNFQDYNTPNDSTTAQTCRPTDDYKFPPLKSTQNADNHNTQHGKIGFAPSLAASTAIAHQVNQPGARIKRKRAVIPDIIIDQSPKKLFSPDIHFSSRVSLTQPLELQESKDLVLNSSCAPRVSSFFYGNTKGKSLANFFNKEDHEEEDEDEYHGFTSVADMKKEKARFEVRMSLAELISNMLAKTPEDRPLMSEINFRTKSLLAKIKSSREGKGINQTPSINRVLSASTSVTNFLLAARHQASKEKKVPKTTSEITHSTNDTSILVANNNSPSSSARSSDSQKQRNSDDGSNTENDSQPIKETNNEEQKNCDAQNVMLNNKLQMPQDKNAIQKVAPSTSRPPKIKPSGQVLPSIPIIKQPCTRSRSTRRNMKAGSMNSGFTTKITQKGPNSISQPNYMIRRESLQDFEYVEEDNHAQSDQSKAHSAFYPHPSLLNIYQNGKV